MPRSAGVKVRQSEAAGLRLLELVRGFTRVIIIDALKSLAEPDASRARSSGAGARPPARLRHAEEVIVFAIEAADVETFGEELSPPVAAAAERGLGLVRREVAA